MSRCWIPLLVVVVAIPVSSEDRLQSADDPPRVVTNSIGMKLALLPAGDFLMGSSAKEIESLLVKYKKRGPGEWYMMSPPSEGARHKVKLTKPFHIGFYEVTVGEFRKFVEDWKYKTEPERDGRGGYGRVDGKWQQKKEYTWASMGYEPKDDHPVVNVSWNDATAFCDWLSKKEGKNYRLPTEAEWEYACRAGTPTRYYWGDDDAQMNDFTWHGGNAGGMPHPVGQKKPNAWFLYDMLGNAYEYCGDWWTKDPYPDKEATDPTGPAAGKERVVRSGSWGTDPLHVRCAFRGGAGPAHYNHRDGFRVVLEAK